MPTAPIPADESLRLQALERYGILDSLPETEYEDLASLAASICETPIAFVSLVDYNRQWCKASYGLDTKEVPRSLSFCAYAIQGDDVFEVPDLAADPRFGDSPLVRGELGLQFYAGAPLVTSDGFRLGTLCVIDRVPRQLSELQRHSLESLARQVVSQLELRRTLKRAQVADHDKAIALAELEASNAVLERFVENVPAATAMLDSSWNYVAVSRRFVHTMNLPAMEVQGKNHFNLCPFWPRSWKGIFERALKGEVQSGQGEVLQPTGRGEMFVDWEVHPWYGANDKNEGIIILIDDVTPVRRMEKLKSEFVSVVSHELRTPLTSIRGALGLLGGGVAGELPERAHQMIDIAHKNAERLVLLINDILDIEKIENGQMKFDMYPLDLLSVVQMAVATNEPYAHTLGVSLQIADEAQESAFVRADEARLLQVLANLLSNAAKFTPHGGHVWVYVQLVGSEDERRVRISVRDQGPGVPLAFANRLFERFAQADSSPTRAQNGTGLGLAISRAIIEKMGGQIGYTPPCQGVNGATFWFELDHLPDFHQTVSFLPQNDRSGKEVR